MGVGQKKKIGIIYLLLFLRIFEMVTESRPSSFSLSMVTFTVLRTSPTCPLRRS